MEQYVDIFLKQFVVLLAGGIITYLGNALRNKQKELEAKDKLLESLVENDCAMLRHEIVNTYYQWKSIGYMPMEIKATLEKCFERYKATGGNSFVVGIMDKVRAMPEEEQ